MIRLWNIDLSVTVEYDMRNYDIVSGAAQADNTKL